VWPNVGHANGTDGDLVMLAPPFTVVDHELEELVRRLTQALSALEAARPPEIVGAAAARALAP